MDIANKTILVTGGAGFIGSHMVDALIERGARVIVIDDLSTGKEQNVNPRAHLYRMNVADPAVVEVMEKERPEIIYHLAWFVLVPKSVADPLLDMAAVTGTLRIVQKAKEIGVRKIIFGSSCFVYGNTTKLPAAEMDPVQLITPYAIAKFSVEQYLSFYYKMYRLPFVVLRYAAVYGPRQVTGAMADYVRCLVRGEQAEIWGDGTKTRDYVYSDDVVKANLCALDLPDDFSDPVFNINTGIETPLNELYQKIAHLVGKEGHPVYRPDRGAEQIRYALDNTKARNQLHWEPTVGLEEGLKKRVDYYLQYGQ